jgi:hypothetical protein
VRTHKIVKQWIEDRTDPFDRQTVVRSIECSTSLLHYTLYTHFDGRLKFYKRHVGNNLYRDTFFPLNWADEQCIAWINQYKDPKTSERLYLFKRD